MFLDWIARTRHLQEQSFGVDYSAMPPGSVEFANYVTTNLYATIEEMCEASHEVAWKPWSRVQGELHREEFIEELVDALHFIANLLAVVNCTDAELSHAYLRKMRINRERQESRYVQRGFGETIAD